MVMGEANKSRGLLSVFMPSTEYLPSFFDENSAFLDRLARRNDPSHSLDVVYSSAPYSCLDTPAYRSEILERFG